HSAAEIAARYRRQQMYGNCRYARCHRRLDRRRTCGLRYPKAAETPQLCRKGCCIGAVPYREKNFNDRGTRENGSNLRMENSSVQVMISVSIPHLSPHVSQPKQCGSSA